MQLLKYLCRKGNFVKLFDAPIISSCVKTKKNCVEGPNTFLFFTFSHEFPSCFCCSIRSLFDSTP